MLRRKPTRIELKLDDLEEFEEKKKEHKTQSTPTATPDATHATPDPNVVTPKTKRDTIHDRIGYNPDPLPQPSRLPIH